MGLWVDRLGIGLIDAGLGAAVLLGVAALVMVGCRQPARRCGIARAAFLGSLALLGLVALAPNRPRIELAGRLRTVIAPLWVTWPGPADPGAVEATLSGQARVKKAVRSLGISAIGPWPGRFLTLAYVMGLGLSLGWLMLGWACSAWLVRNADAPSPSTTAVYDRLRRPGWIRPRLLVTPRVRRPVLLGILRPAIVIPPELDEPDAAEQLRLSLLHELAHAERGDAWFSMIGAIAQSAWFFLPWVWWMRRQMRLDQEFLADHRASHGFGSSGSYASSLVDLAAPPSASVTAGPARIIPLSGPGSALFQRVLMLIRCPYPVEPLAPRWWRWSLPLVVAGITLFSSSLTLRSAETAAGPGPASLAPAQAATRFQLVRLVVPETPAQPDGFTPPYNLPVRMPQHFDLALEVWAEPSDLDQTRVAGYRVASTQGLSAAANTTPTWHQIHIHRDATGLRGTVDDHPITIDPADRVASDWLTIQAAPGRLGLFRNLILEW
jgi:bla regulator protein blaR1